MKKTFGALAVASLTSLALPHPALAQGVGLPGYAPAPPPGAVAYEPPPSQGTGLIISGGIMTAVGTIGLATAAVCKTSVFPPDSQSQCLFTTLLGGGTSFAIGMTLLIIGLSERASYNEWVERHRYGKLLTHVGVAPLPGGAGLGWKVEF